MDVERLLAVFRAGAVPRLEVPVVTPRGLYRMKVATVRLKDRADAEMLRRRFGAEVE